MTTPADAGLEGMIEALRGCLQEVQSSHAHVQRLPEVGPRFDHLVKTIAGLGTSRPARPVTCPDEYRAMWESFVKGKRSDLPAAALRFLAWEPPVATDLRFLDLLQRETPHPTARTIQGLVHSLHQVWPATADAPDLHHIAEPAERIFKLVHGYQGPNSVVCRWRDARGMFFFSAGPDQFAIDMFENFRTLDEHFAFWSLSPRSRYARVAVHRTVIKWLQQVGRNRTRDEARLGELLFWSGWEPAEFKRCIDLALHSEAIETIPSLRELLKVSILGDTRLGDPRLPRNANKWLGVSDPARRAFVRWLSADDIEFFFEHVLPPGSDPHGRKKFWLRYIGAIQMSRPLLCEEDRLRLIHASRFRDDTPRNFGVIEGTPPTSAFLLDFGSVVVVEFSRTGNAGYVYPRVQAAKVIKDFWSPVPFAASALRARHIPHDRIIHSGAWQGKAANILAFYGVRRS